MNRPVLPENLKHLRPFLEVFYNSHPNYDRNVFLMMRFGLNPIFTGIHSVIADALKQEDLECIRADGRDYANTLWDNICVCMLGCRFGVVVYENIDTAGFNPNINLEVGFMLALGKKMLFLKESQLPAMPTDIMSHIYRIFDISNLRDSINVQIQKWVSDLNIGNPKIRRMPLRSSREPALFGMPVKPAKVHEIIPVIRRNLPIYFSSDLPENELQVTRAVKVLLSAAGFEFSDDNLDIHFDRRCFRPDLALHTSEIALQVKLCRSASQVKRILAEIVADIRPCKSEFKDLIFVIYDFGFMPQEDVIKSEMEDQNGIHFVIVKEQEYRQTADL